MLEMIKMYRGTLRKAVNQNKEVYYDWRCDYYNKDGIIMIYEDTFSKKGKYIIRFMPIKENGEVDDTAGCLKTSYGDLFLDYVLDKICLLTKNSSYYFDEVVFDKKREKSI